MNTDIQNISQPSLVPPSFEGEEWKRPESITIIDPNNYEIIIPENK